MTAKTLYRIASVVFVLFAFGHTFGFLTFTPQTAEGQAVFDAMNRVGFQVHAATLTYGGFYKGFGLYITAYLLFSAMLAWQLSNLTAIPQAASLGWTFFVLQLASLVLSSMYFSIEPAIFSAVLAVCLAWAAWSATRTAKRQIV